MTPTDLEAQLKQPADAGRPTQAGESRPIASTELLRGERCVEISHNGTVYRLQATRLGKLILTK